jgi:hypothetical protein
MDNQKQFGGSLTNDLTNKASSAIKDAMSKDNDKKDLHHNLRGE